MSWFVMKQEETRKTPKQETMWIRCKACNAMIYKGRWVENLHVCPECDFHGKLTAQERIAFTVDEGSFQEFGADIAPADPLGFACGYGNYSDKVQSTRKQTALNEAVVTGKGTIQGIPVVLAVMDFRFFGGSLGSGTGEKILEAANYCYDNGLPYIVVSASGGARMEEGILSLMQMAKTCAGIARLNEKGIPYISILTDPTYGGVTASYSMVGDIHLAEPHARIGFAGRRVIEQTIRQKLPDDFQKSEYLLEHGFIDKIVRRTEMRATLAQILGYCQTGRKGGGGGVMANLMDFESHLNEMTETLAQLKALSESDSMDLSGQIADLEQKLKAEREKIYAKLSPWQTVQIARHPKRPILQDYIETIFTDFIELHGDRRFSDDRGLVGGFATIGGIKVMLIGHNRGKNVTENIERNFGMALPDGYRKALRLMEMAERFGLPVVTFIDTSGAYPGMHAEERGQAEAIARNLTEMARLKVPIVSVVTGEGGSGGALGIGVGNVILMLKHAIYSVISPEGCASILWRDRAYAEQAAEALKITAHSLKKLGVVDEIIPEPLGGAHNDPAATAKAVKAAVVKQLKRLMAQDVQQVVDQRFDKYAHLGVFTS